MNRFQQDIRLTPSVLDRLLDDDPGRLLEAPASRSRSIEELKQSVRRDLEWLLNTRQNAGGVPPGLKELNHSLAAYGLPDFSTFTVKNPADQVRLQRILQLAISTFEPRLDNVTVTLVPARDLEQKLRFRIDGRLKIEPVPEPVTFDTVLQAANDQYVVKAE